MLRKERENNNTNQPSFVSLKKNKPNSSLSLPFLLRSEGAQQQKKGEESRRAALTRKCFNHLLLNVGRMRLASPINSIQSNQFSQSLLQR